VNLAETTLGKSFLEQGIKLLVRNPERNLPLMVSWAEKIAREEHHKEAIRGVKKFITDKDSNWYRLALRLLTRTDPRIKERIAVNFFVNSTLLGVPRQKEMEKELGVAVPWAVLMDPTERCNLNCVGCWAGKYQQVKELEFDLMDRICREAEELGIYFIVLSGGEPLLRKDDIVRLAENHPSQVFHIFTNGTLIDDGFVGEMKRLGNIVTALSIDGLEEKTDERRGRGVFRRLMQAMDLLRENNCIFGISTTYTRQNTEELGSDEFIDLMVEKGACFAWYFTYIPVGKDEDLEYMATPEQRKYMFERVNYFRQAKPIFVVDFWNDGEASCGCIAGGRRYFHINAAGDVEPCAFIHYSTCNIRHMSLKEALQNPLFKAYQKRQPFSTNLLRPCPLIDNPEMLRDIVHESGARSTHLLDSESVDVTAKKLSGYAREWGRVADEIWSERTRVGKNQPCGAV